MPKFKPNMSKSPALQDDAWQLFVAAAHGDATIVERLIAADPELMHHQIWYEFPIHFAVRAGHPNIVHMLLEAGTNPARSNFTYSSWQSLLPLADDRGRDDIRPILVAEMQKRFNYCPDYKPLWDAISKNDFDEVSALISRDSRLVNIGDEHGNRAIHWAVLARRIPIIQLLLDAGADINARRADLQSPSHISNVGDYWFRKKHESDPETKPDQVTQFLLKHGAEYEFSVAVSLGDIDRVTAELQRDPKLATRLHPSQRSPPGRAAKFGHLEIVRLLLKHGANPNLPEACADRGLALFEASARNDLEMTLHWIQTETCGRELSIRFSISMTQICSTSLSLDLDGSDS
jgi:ankyrin repeat protein